MKKKYFVPKKGVRDAISQKGGIRIMREVPQFGAFMIPVHLALTELLGFHFVFVQNCECKMARGFESKIKN